MGFIVLAFCDPEERVSKRGSEAAGRERTSPVGA